MDKENRPLISGFLVAFAGVLLFAILAFAVRQGRTEAFDLHVRDAVHSRATPMLTRAMSGITQLGQPTILILLGAVLVWRLSAAGRPRAAVLFLIAVVGAEVCDQLLKLLFRRPRPEVFFGIEQPITYSFPSGHSVASCCFYGVLAAILSVATPSRLHKAAIWSAAAFLTLAVGFSRVYLGVHYPTDVLGGYAVAVTWVALVRAVYWLWLRRRPTPSIS